MVYNNRNETIRIATTKVKLGLVHNMRFDLSVLLIGSTSSESGYSERLGFQLTYLSGENWENSVFLPCFLKFDHALSQCADKVIFLSVISCQATSGKLGILAISRLKFQDTQGLAKYRHMTSAISDRTESPLFLGENMHLPIEAIRYNTSNTNLNIHLHPDEDDDSNYDRELRLLQH
ncbi:reverse transcriptase domain-containing protein [Senna tora]|uniref:Reverse transcriptase domain-containing protein n=1 Tax=Senna tora TaxID=362788 RepID=A0A834W0C7_9FABA|nr:reverse transcriptase domain-containing protein [Senna tora]